MSFECILYVFSARIINFTSLDSLFFFFSMLYISIHRLCTCTKVETRSKRGVAFPLALVQSAYLLACLRFLFFSISLS